jgi:alpha-beta hydrolase superfamily lysophospholipase
MLQGPRLDPARSYQEALERVRRFQALDDEHILPVARTALLDHGRRTPLAAVLLHGFTNHPGQYATFAPQVHASGINVFIPRLPEQGDRNRMTRRLVRITAESLLSSASEAVDIACGLGERVCILGISSSALLAAYSAQYRADVARAICVAPVFAILNLPYWLSRCAEYAMLALPNVFLWWDPTKREHQLPPTAYPRFPTRGLAQSLRVGDAVYDASRKVPLAARSVTLVTNARDPAVNNRVTEQVLRAWQQHGGRANVTEYCFTGLPKNHDIIDPQNPLARTDIVYPRLLEMICATP